VFARSHWLDRIQHAWLEHRVLNELQATVPAGTKIRYWRTKHGNEIDFVLVRRGRPPVAIECKWSADDLDLRNLKVFRRHYEGEDSFVVAADVDEPFTRTEAGFPVRVLGLSDLVEEVCR